MVRYYEDLPEELRHLFPADIVKAQPEIRQYIVNGWKKMIPAIRQSLVSDLRYKDPSKRVLFAVQQSTSALQ